MVSRKEKYLTSVKSLEVSPANFHLQKTTASTSEQRSDLLNDVLSVYNISRYRTLINAKRNNQLTTFRRKTDRNDSVRSKKGEATKPGNLGKISRVYTARN